MDIEIPPIVQQFLPLAKGILLAILILILGGWASKLADKNVRKLFKKRELDEALGRFLGGLARYALYAAAVIAALGAVGVETTSIVAVFASAGLAVGLALQGSLANFASGVMILFFRPFTLGDRITAAGHTAEVEDIGIFATTLLTLDNETIIIPNKAIMSDSIVNHTKRGTIRANIDVGVAYGSDVVQVIQVLEAAAQKEKLVLEDPAVAIAFVGLGASSLDFTVRVWCKTDDYIQVQHDVRAASYNALNEANIEIPFNQLVVHRAEAA